jgi:hypothetical protein
VRHHYFVVSFCSDGLFWKTDELTVIVVVIVVVPLTRRRRSAFSAFPILVFHHRRHRRHRLQIISLSVVLLPGIVLSKTFTRPKHALGIDIL